MIRSEQFRISHRPYAVDLSSVTATVEPLHGRYSLDGTARAVWYRRQGGVTRACVGKIDLWSHYLPEPLPLDDPAVILGADLDGRYGGDCEGRWDGERYWGAQEPETIEAHLALLRPMLDHFPTVPEGYDGWWRFS